MNKKEFKPLPPFRKWILQNFPFIEDDFDAITSYQLWCKVVEYINKVAYNEKLLEDANNELVQAFNDLKQYVDDYFSDLNVQTEVDNKLDEMALDGTLERIINEELFSDLNNTINDVKDRVDTIEPIVYDNEKNIKFPTLQLGMKRIFRFLEDDEYQSLQGMCITPNNTIICSLTNGNNNKIVEINYTTGAIVRASTFTFGWANGITYDVENNLVYVIPRGEDTNTYLKTIKVLEPQENSFSLLSTVSFEDFIQSIYYDKEKDELYLLSEYNLRSTNGFKIYKVDSNFNVLGNSISLDYSGELNNLRVQNFAIKDNYIYIISSDPKCLIVYNIDGTVFKKYTLNEMISNLYYSGEYQDIDFLDNQCYISSADNVATATANIESINQLFEIDFNGGYISDLAINTNVHDGRSITLAVDSSSTAINPDGSSTNKFKSINEALRYNGTSTINVANGTYNGVDLRSKTNKNIIGDSSSVIVKGLNINYSSNCYIENVTINEDTFNNNGFINIYQSDITLKAINISGNKYGIYVGARSKCKLSTGIDLSGITSDNQIYVRSESVLYTPSTYYTIQKHNESATIIGGVKLFENEREMVTGEFDFDNNMNYIFDDDKSLDDFFKEIAIIYKIGNNFYEQRFFLRSSNNPMQLGFDNMAGNGAFTCSRAYVDINNKKFRIRFSRVGTTTNQGVTTVVTNDSNTSYDDNSIIVVNAILF